MNASIKVVVTRDAVLAEPLPTQSDCGAVVDFHGVVRADENGDEISGLFYEAYQPMAEQQMEKIIRELLDHYPCRLVAVTHRLGFVAAGQASIAVRVAAPHRQEAISFLAEFMNRLKKDVPIWKKTSQSSEPKS